MAINTRDGIYEYIFRKLGADYVEVEVSEDSLNDIVSDTIKEFSEFAYSGELEEVVVLDVTGSGVYNLPHEIQSVIKVAKGTTAGGISNFGGNYGAGFVPDIWSEQFFSSSSGISGIINSMVGVSNTRSMLDKFMGDDINYDFNSHKKILRVFEPYQGSLVIHYTKEYVPDAIDYIYDETWIKKMCVARARLDQSTVVGKYTQALVGGGTINSQDMRSLAQEEIQVLTEELQLKYSGPAPIFVG